MRYRLNFGQYRSQTEKYKAGDIIETDHRLDEEFKIVDVVKGLAKFTPIDDDEVPNKPGFNLKEFRNAR